MSSPFLAVYDATKADLKKFIESEMWNCSTQEPPIGS